MGHVQLLTPCFYSFPFFSFFLLFFLFNAKNVFILISVDLTVGTVFELEAKVEQVIPPVKVEDGESTTHETRRMRYGEEFLSSRLCRPPMVTGLEKSLDLSSSFLHWYVSSSFSFRFLLYVYRRILLGLELEI
jgi:hypothetical protein